MEIYPSSTRGGGHRDMLLLRGSAYRLAIPFITRKHPLAWLDYVQIVMDNHRVVLLLTSRGASAKNSPPARTRLNNIVRSSSYLPPRSTRGHCLAAGSWGAPPSGTCSSVLPRILEETIAGVHGRDVLEGVNIQEADSIFWAYQNRQGLHGKLLPSRVVGKVTRGCVSWLHFICHGHHVRRPCESTACRT